MKITIVTRKFWAGGAERVIAQLIREWTRQNVFCSLILLEKDEKFYEIPQSVSVYEVGCLSKNPAIDKIKRYAKIKNEIVKIKPDVVLAMPEDIGVYMIAALRGTGIPVVVSERNNPWVMPTKKMTRFLRRVLYPFADGFVFQTKQASSFFKEIIQNRGVILPNPLDLDRIPEPYQGVREKIIVGAGRLEKQKNFPLLIDAFYIFYQSHKDYKLVIYGEGTLRNELEEYALSKFPSGVVEFPGKTMDLLQNIRNASIFALSSEYEGMPNVLIEALAMGIPCVATDCPSGGPAELIEDGVNGSLVSPGNVNAFATELKKIVDNNDIGRSYSVKSVMIKDALDASKVCKAWLDYLKKVVSERNR